MLAVRHGREADVAQGSVDQPASVAVRDEVRLGSRVYCGDTEVGRLERVVLSPSDQRVTHLLVHRGLVPHRDVLVPVEVAERATDEAVWLRLSAEEFERLSPYDPERYVSAEAGAAATGRHERSRVLFALPFGRARPGALLRAEGGQTAAGTGGPDGSRSGVLLSRGTRVVCAGGDVGRVDDVLLDPTTRQAIAFVVRKGRFLRQDVVVPVDWVSEVQSDKIVLNVDRSQLDRLPRYRPDSEVAADVRQALYDYDPIGALDFSTIRVEVVDGVVTLSGNVSHMTNRHMAEDLAGKVEGVKEVRNQLVSDDALSIQVAAAIGKDERCANTFPRVYAHGGVVTLSGTMPSLEAKMAAAEIAQRVPGVRAVRNVLVVEAVPTPS